MNILQKYIFKEYVRNLIVTTVVFLGLFEIVDIFDRLDNILEADASFWLTIQYFLYKIPVILNLLIPISALVATLFTVGMLSKNSEITAMRASGYSIFKISYPIIVGAVILSVFSLILDEKISPYFNKKIKEIYNLDIQQKDKQGTYSQSDFWWREDGSFYSAQIFDSRTNQIFGFNEFRLNSDFKPVVRITSKEGTYLGDNYGWRFLDVLRFRFMEDDSIISSQLKSQPVTIKLTPEDLYTFNSDPFSMSYMELKSYITQQQSNGISTNDLLADLYAKTSFPFVVLVVTIIVIPFALRPARSGNMTSSAIAGVIISFSYYFVHSLSLALGRAEIIPPFLAAWMGNIILGSCGIILMLGSESAD